MDEEMIIAELERIADALDVVRAEERALLDDRLRAYLIARYTMDPPIPMPVLAEAARVAEITLRVSANGARLVAND